MGLCVINHLNVTLCKISQRFLASSAGTQNERKMRFEPMTRGTLSCFLTFLTICATVWTNGQVKTPQAFPARFLSPSSILS